MSNNTTCHQSQAAAENCRIQRKATLLPPLLIWICSIAFVGALNFAHANYLYPVHEFWGFPFYPMGVVEWLFLISATAVASLTLPHYVNRPSALVLLILYLLVYLPSLTITLATKPDALDSYGYELVALVFGFGCVGIGTRAFAHSNRGRSQRVLLGRQSQVFLLLVFLALFFFILFSFRDVIRFVGLDDIYVQRAAGRSRNLLEAYSQTYLGYVFSPAVFAIGLLRKNYIFLALGMAGFALMFGVTAERSIFLLPLAIAGLHLIMRSRLASKALASWTILSLAVVVMIAVYFEGSHRAFEVLALYLVFRVVAIPGSMFWQYSDVFSGVGQTYWSNVTGVSLLIDVPTVFAGAQNWPQLGYLVAREILNLESNSNANLFAYDGIAAAGAMGILAASFFLGSWLVVLDRVTKGADPVFVLLITFPMAFSLTNGSVFSLMLSFGGFFWIAFFVISARRKRLSLWR